MPYRRLPNTMPAVIRTLKTARDTLEASLPSRCRCHLATVWGGLYLRTERTARAESVTPFYAIGTETHVPPVRWSYCVS